MSEGQDIISLIVNHWEVIFLYVFKYLKDIDTKLDILHIDNASTKVEIENIKKWVTTLEQDFKNCNKCDLKK